MAHDKYPEFDGVTLDKAAKALKLEPEMAVTVLLCAANGGIPCCYFCLAEEDMLTIMKRKLQRLRICQLV